MPPDRTPADREPAHRADGGGAGSVVVGLDLARVVDHEAMAERVDTLSLIFENLRESLSQAVPAVQTLGREMSRAMAAAQADPPMSEYDAGDAMRWSPPADGEETPPCPA